ncbi:MAG: response regulator [Deltaproteobacteria bacterium]|nr:response regulator [Deltaproteobacteria bacterium]
MSTIPGHRIEVLYVEDNPGDVRLTTEALREAKVVASFHVIADGLQALAYLKRQGKYRDATLPDVVLLDLKLPGMSGCEILAAMKADPALRSIPVVVLTSSRAEKDIAQSYALGASCYIVKPVDLDQFLFVVRSINEFWLEVVTLPGGTRVP